MSRPAVVLLALLPLLVATAPAPQSEGALRSALEGTRVTLLIDMPGTSKGVSLYPERDLQVDFRENADRIKDNGVSIRTGEEATITLIKVKGKHIEFQLNGGGYGTAGDEIPSRQYISKPSETQRERDLKEEIDAEEDRGRKSRLQRELRDLKDRRERDYQRDVRDAAERYERAVERVGRARLLGGSRFNVRYDRNVPAVALTSAGLVAALREVVEFPGEVASEVQFDNAPVAQPPAAGDTDTQPLLPIAKGMSRGDVDAMFGYATHCTESAEGRLAVLTCSYVLEEATAEVTFVNDATVSFVIASQ